MKSDFPVEMPPNLSRSESILSQSRNRLGRNNRFPLIARGAIGALIGNICCLLPAVALAIGLTGGLAAAIVGLSKFRLYGIATGLIFVVITSWLSLRREKLCCTEEEYKRRQIFTPLTIIASFIIIYFLIMYLIIPIFYKLA